ncbi:hypothetical protein SUGI_0331300 [Cryptomeria japonica]|nr:hypothetical protein SUGI_0331300 [Cryptomeria japonica]
MPVEKERRLSDFEKGDFGGAIALQNRKFSGRAQIEGAENLRHFCKICERRFACGRALGGHMRIHGDSEKSNPRVIGTEAAMNGWCEAPVQDGTDLKKRTNDLAYALRTNRKRSWVLTEQSGALLTGMLEDGRPALVVTSSRACDECGKEFSSWEALLAHMKCSHSGNREQILYQENQSPVSQIQLQPAAKGKRSKRVKCPDDCHSPAASGTKYNEEEDMANCLVMLAMAGKSSSLEKPTQGKTKFLDDSDKIDGTGKKYKCRTCQRVFSSFQALGGHRASNHHYNCSAPSKIGNDSSCSEDEIVTREEGLFTAETEGYSVVLPEKRKWDQEVTNNESAAKGRLHECSICERKFSSGQALGGHKRCHRTTSAAMVHCSQMQESVEQDKTSLLPHHRGQLIDLNLPAPCHDDQYEAEHTDKAATPIPNDLVQMMKPRVLKEDLANDQDLPFH